MERRLNDLFLRFKTKGFMPIEITGLIKDVFNIIGNGETCAITTIDQELEDFGWGVGIIDNITYELITSLLEYNNSTDVERYLHKCNLGFIHTAV